MRYLIFTLSKVLIAAAWADGEVSHEEINTLKWLLLRLRSEGKVRGAALSGQEWAELEIYLANPIEADERARLVVELQDALRTHEQKDLAREALREVMAADGQVTVAEREVLAEIDAALDETEVGLIGGLGRLLGGRMRERRAEVAGAPNREEFFDDFLHNRVYYLLGQQPAPRGVSLPAVETDRRRLALAAGLLARVAQIAGQTGAGARQLIEAYLQEEEGLDEPAATFLAQVALEGIDQTTDLTRMTTAYARLTDRDKKRGLLVALFRVAAEGGDISLDTHEEIRLVARGIKLVHQDFIAAKLAVTRDS